MPNPVYEIMNKELKLILIGVVCLAVVSECKYGYVTWEGGTAVAHVTENAEKISELHVARATYSNEINKTGWAYLELHTAADSTDERQAYAAGYLEGFLTRDLIWMHWQNTLKGYCYNKTEVCGRIEEFVDTNEEYIADMVRKNPNDPYWYQMKLVYIQIEGVAVGYNHATSDSYQWLTIRDFIWLNMLGDLEDLAMAVSMPAEVPDGLLFGDHCSGLVKLLPDLSDLFTAHVTWNNYQSMLRFQKVYVLDYKLTSSSDKVIPGRKMSFTSYPGLVQSLDDFYIISSGLVAAETTISNSNRTLFQFIKPVGQVMEYARAMVANRLAREGAEWVDIFRRHNSGTYNNQWYIVDYKRFTARSGVRAGLLWVLEQLPGYTEAADLTRELSRAGYHPSYNIARFPRVFNRSGGNERVAAHGDWFAYDSAPRARIYRRAQAGIGDMGGMLAVMRYNDYRHDPLARCACRPPYSACNAIAARDDLNPANGTYPFRALGHRNHGATDAKVTSASLRTGFQFLAVSGPAHNISRGVPPFAWTEFDMGPQISHIGHPNLWMFKPEIHRWEWE